MGSANPRSVFQRLGLLCLGKKALSQLAIYHLNHRYVGKKSSEPGTAAAKVRYMVRAKACEKIVTVGMATHPKALERAANENEKTSRANARVCDTFHIALPKEMTAEQRIATTRSFLWQLTDGGKARAFAAFHGMDTHNPHIHVMFFDRDQDGKRVQGMSERGSTEKMRILWENACNAKLEEYGYDVRIDRRTLEAQLEKSAEVGIPATENAPESTDVPLDIPAEETTLAPQERWMSELEKHYVEKLSPEERILHEDTGHIDREQYESTAQRVEDALDYDAEFQRLQAVQGQIEHLRERAAQADREAKTAAQQSAIVRKEAKLAAQASQRAENDLAPLKKSSGKLRGFEIFGWKSPKRHRAEQAQSRVTAENWRQTIFEINSKALAYQAQVAENDAAHYQSRQAAAEINLVKELHESFGKDATLKQAEAIHVRSVSKALEGVQPHEVYAEYENGSLTAEQAIRAFELMGCPEMINAVEQWHRQELAADNDNGFDL